MTLAHLDRNRRGSAQKAEVCQIKSVVTSMLPAERVGVQILAGQRMA